MMAISGIQSISNHSSASASSASAPTAERTALDREMFLRLLVTQFTNQNPLNPVSGADFTAQLAQLSTLESLQQLGGHFRELLRLQGFGMETQTSILQSLQQFHSNFRELLLLQGLGQSANLIGKTILFESLGQSELQHGFVQAITLKNGRIFLEVGDTLVGLDQVRGVQAGPVSS